MVTLLSLPEVKGLIILGLLVYVLPWPFIFYLKKLWLEKHYAAPKYLLIAKNLFLWLWFALGGAIFGITLGGTAMLFYGDSIIFPCLLFGLFLGAYFAYRATRKRV